jgi:hypothetical protein
MSKEKFCNKCGQSCSIPLDDRYNDYGLIDARVTGGYESSVLDDCTSYMFSLCENCLVDLFDSFVTPPVVHDLLVCEYNEWQEVQYISPKKRL